MSKLFVDPPALVKPAEDLAELARQINAEHEAGEDATRQGLEHFRAAGERLIRAKKKCKHGEWLPWLKKNVRFSQPQAWRYMRVAREWDKLCTANNLRDALLLLTEEGEEEEVPAPADYLTVEQWSALKAAERKAVLAPAASDKKFNAQDGDSIEWALWSWNPVTGCKHDCPYCYARDIATQGPTAHAFPNGFVPTLVPSRLLAPENTPFPEEDVAQAKLMGDEVRAMGLGNVFVCSMADLFGRWVPAEWIEAVLDRCRAAPRWNFLFLTKFPVRMAEFDFPENAWVGTTVDCQARVANAERSFRKVKAGVKWLSCEPLLEPLKFADLGAFDWIVLGGASRSAQTPEWHPPRQWSEDLRRQAEKLGVRVYEKANLLTRVRQYPGVEAAAAPAKAPEALRYLPEVEGK